MGVHALGVNDASLTEGAPVPAFSIYGCWLQPIDAIFGPTIPGYVIMARCDAKCHAMKMLISEQEMNLHNELDGLFDMIYENILRAFRRVHP